MAGQLWLPGLLYVQRQRPAIARVPVTLLQRVGHFASGDDRRVRLLPGAGLRRLGRPQSQRRRRYRDVPTDVVANRVSEFLNYN